MANGIVLNIDTTKSEFQNPMVQLRQGDGNYQSLAVTVTSNGEPFDLTGWTITFMGTTAGGFKIVDAASVVTNTLQGEFTYTPTKAWGQDQGEFKNAYFEFVKSDETASGASFRVNVLDAVDLTAEEAQNYISVVDVMIDQVKTDMETKLAETKKTLTDTQTQANAVQTNVNDLNTNVNDLKSQNNNIRMSDNVWTGANAFTNQIDGSLKSRFVSFTDFASVAADTRTYAGFWFTMDNKPINGPFGDTSWSIIEVLVGNGQTTGVIKFTKLINSETWITTANGGSLTGWHKLSTNETVVHNTGNETVAGDKTFTGSNTFTQLINGSLETKLLTAPVDLFTLHNGTYFVSGFDLSPNMPIDAYPFFVVEVIETSDNGYISLTDSGGRKFFTVKNGGNWEAAWRKVSNDSTVVHNTGTETIAGDKTFTGSTDIRNQKQYKASFTIGANTINLTRIGSIVYVNAKTIETINGGNSYGSIPIGFTPANNSVINFILSLNQGSCLFQSSEKNVWFPVTANVDSNLSGSYLTNDASPAQ